jgi:hypothetical protein
MVIAHFLSTSDGMLFHCQDAWSLSRASPGMVLRKSSISSLVHHSHCVEPTWFEVVAHSGFLSIGELWMCSSWANLAYSSSTTSRYKGLLPCRIRNHSAVLQNTESRSFHEDFSIRGSPRSKLGSVTKTGSHDGRLLRQRPSVLSRAATAASIRHRTRQQPRATTDNRPNQAQPVGRHCHLPALPVPSLQSILVPDILQAQTAHVSTIVRLFLLNGLKRAQPSSTLVEVIRRTRLPATYCPQELLPSTACFMVHGCNLAGRCERSIDPTRAPGNPAMVRATVQNLWDFVHTPLMISSIQPTPAFRRIMTA